MSALFSLIPICLLIFAGYLYWFRDHIVTLLELSSHREIVVLSVACSSNLNGCWVSSF